MCTNENKIQSLDIFSHLIDGYHTIGVAPITQYMYSYNKNSNTRWSSPHMVKVIFPYLQDLLLKEKNSLPLWAKSFL